MAVWGGRGAVFGLLCGLLLATPATAVVVSGAVTRFADGQPALGTTVRLFRVTGPFSQTLIGEIVVDAAGAYTLSSPGVFGNFRVEASLATYLTAVAAFAAQDDVPLVRDFVLSQPSTITVTLRDAVTLQPVADTSVRFYSATGGITGQDSDAQGQVVSNPLPGGSYRVCALEGTDVYRNECFENQFMPADDSVAGIAPVALGSGENLSLTIDLDATGAAIGGVLTDRYFDTPIDDPITFQLYADDGTLLTSVALQPGPGGAYSLRGLPPGAYRLSAGSDSFRAYTRRLYPDIPCSSGCTITDGALLTVGEGQTAGDVDFDLHPGGVALGRITDAASGSPIAGVTVANYSPSLGWLEVARAQTDANGEFELPHFRAGLSTPVGTVGVTTHINESWPNVPCYIAQSCTSGTLVSFSVDEVRAGFDFALDAAGSIQGSVLAAGPGPSLPATIQIRNASNTLTTQAYTSDASTAYASVGLPPGTYYAAATSALGCEVYLAVPCASPFPIDVATATPIVVTGPGVVSGIDFTLPSDVLLRNGFEG